ncbi:UNC-like C-terminal-domain-containing protein [Lobosporangium transversale]|uniref:UNC-like C-terminal-domain-containing protein n=1 Tax=Lobosporangium transversale TaxID=64571 RepID=A0A1Y2GPY4_9FUNG|nr:UNC-like C-terminal-domain-containing protein [Lobosporangium transversale]ORZ18342.1 UNC-like C-terminal-domain-containing protein [Lobosporangium transversale]|eukprot:XP_021882137.1 UNC-like C-terminal-domain-containing protein [Lobosporangium transversale]
MELLEKQGKLHGKEAPRRRIGFYGSSSTVSGNQDGRGNTGLTELEKELVSGLIDEALEKYSADAIAKPDYALFSAGGRIIPRLTSQDYHHTVAPTFWGNLGLKYFVKLPRREKPAQKAIEPDIHAGECWAMEGQQGQLGIRLARRIVVTEITIEHADPSVVLDMDSAPKEIEVWGLRGSEDAAPTATSHHASHTKPKTRQTFSIPLSMQKWPFVGVVLRIKSNWGHPKYTCMYRVRVHGYEPNA